MHVDVYVEELSAKKALDQLVPRIVGGQHSFQVLNFRNKKELLREIPKRLKGYARWIPEDWRIAVLVDEDRQDCHVLKAQLVGASRQAGGATGRPRSRSCWERRLPAGSRTWVVR